MILTSHFTVDQEFHDYFAAWWREFADYVHEIEERILPGNEYHLFSYSGTYITDIPDTFVDYEFNNTDWPDNGDDPEWELHVNHPDDNIIVEHEHYVESYWEGLSALTIGTYSNSHWLTSEVDGFTGGFLDYDHLLRQNFTFTIEQDTTPPSSGGGGNNHLVRSFGLPVHFHKSSKLATLNLQYGKVIVKEISNNQFKIISNFRFKTERENKKFNRWSANLLEQKMKKQENALVNTLVSFKKQIPLEQFLEISNYYNWTMRTIKLRYHYNNKESYLTVTLPNGASIVDIFKRFKIDLNNIDGVYFAEIESSPQSIFQYYSVNKNNIKTFNCASIFVENWLTKQGLQPSTIVHLGFVG